MPLPVIGAGVAALGSAVIGSGANAIMTGKMNRKSRDFSREMYARQRADSLADWAMQNEYNSPEAQMARLKAAGLNPNMVYGSGSAANTAGAPHEASAMSPKMDAPQIDTAALQQGLFAGIDMEIKRQQLANLKTQSNVMNADVLKKTADIGRTQVLTDRGRYDLDLASQLRENVIETASANLKAIGTRTELGVAQIGESLVSQDIKRKFGFSIAEQNLTNMRQLNTLRDAANARAESTNVADLKIKAQKVINMMQDKARTWEETIKIQEASKNLRRANTLADLDIYMKSAGFDWRDPMLIRQLRMSSRGYSK